MEKIRNNELYNKLRKAHEEGLPLWEELFDENDALIDSRIPELTGGLDHIEITEDWIIFHDTGVSGKDSRDFAIGRELFSITERKKYIVMQTSWDYYDETFSSHVILIAERNNDGTLSGTGEFYDAISGEYHEMTYYDTLDDEGTVLYQSEDWDSIVAFFKAACIDSRLREGV